MFMRSMIIARNFRHYLTDQARSYSQNPVSNQVSKYFCRAKLIDSIRLNLRSGSVDLLLPLLNNPNLDSFVVANALRSAPSPDSALSFLEALKRVPGFVHTQHTLYAIAKVLAKAGRLGQLRKLIDATNAGKFPKVPRVSFVDSMRWYATAGDLESVLRVWGDFRALGKQPCIESYNIVMGIYVQMGKDMEAVQTFREMLQGGAIPNPRTFTIVMEHLVKSGNVEKAREIFDILPRMKVKRTLRQYSVLVDSFVNSKQFDAVKRLLREMKTKGLLPPRSMLSQLESICGAANWEGLDEIVKEMAPDDRIKRIELGEDHNGDANGELGNDPNSDSGNGAIQLKPWLDPSALASALRNWRPDDVCALEEAQIVWTSRLVCKMIRQFKSPQTACQFFFWVADQCGFVHDIHTYSGVITKLSSHGKVDLVDNILLRVKTDRIKMSTCTIRQIIDYYGLFREADAALRVFSNIQALCSPCSELDRVLLYSSLLRTLLKCGRDSDSMNMIEQMFSLGTCPDSQTFSGLVHHFAGKGDLRTVQKLLDMIRRSGTNPDAYMYKTLIRTYCKSGRATLALRFLEDMSNSGLEPDAETKFLLVRSLWKEGRLREASNVEDTCKETEESLPLPSSSQMFNVNSTDLIGIQKLYCGSFQGIDG